MDITWDSCSQIDGSNPSCTTKSRALNSDGRVPALQAGCRRFDSGRVHQNRNAVKGVPSNSVFFQTVYSYK